MKLRLTERRGKRHNSAVIVEDFNTSLKLQIEQRGRKSVRIDTKNIINQQDLTDIY